jgi:uncharacterized protein (TIGR00369 family)
VHKPAGKPSAGPWREPVRGGHPTAALSARPGRELLDALLAEAIPQPPLSRLTGMRLVEFGPGTATFRLPLSGWLRAADGAIPLGPLTIPADAAMACAVIAGMPEATAVTTSELALRQLRPARPGGVLLARAKVLEPGPPIGLADVSLTDETGALIAHGSSLLVVLPFIATPADDDRGDGHGAPGGHDGDADAPTTAGRDDGDADAPATAGRDGGPDPWERPAPEPTAGGRSPLQRLTGLRPVAVTREDTTFALPTTPWLCAPPPGRVQGGAVATLAEAAMTAAIRHASPAAIDFTPIELKLNYLRPLAADGREARARARVIQAGRRIAVAGADVVDADGRPIAVASGSALGARG